MSTSRPRRRDRTYRESVGMTPAHRPTVSRKIGPRTLHFAKILGDRARRILREQATQATEQK